MRAGRAQAAVTRDAKGPRSRPSGGTQSRCHRTAGSPLPGTAISVPFVGYERGLNRPAPSHIVPLANTTMTIRLARGQMATARDTRACIDDCVIGHALDGMCVGLVLMNEAGRITWLNRAAERTLDLGKNDIGKLLAQVLKDPHLAAFWHKARESTDTIMDARFDSASAGGGTEDQCGSLRAHGRHDDRPRAAVLRRDA